MPAIRKVELSEEDRIELDRLIRSGTSEQRLVLRARIVLAAAEGMKNEDIANRCGCSPGTARLWRNRWIEDGIEGLADAPGRGRKPTYGPEDHAQIVAETLKKPTARTHWSTRRLADTVKPSKSTIHRIWKQHDLKPHRQETFKYSNDPQLKEKVVDVVGLYLNPPENAIVLSIDEKSQMQALERTQPLLPMRAGDSEKRTHDYRRHGTLTLFAALDIATGEVVGKCKQRHRHQEFLDFLRHLDKTFPDKDLHLVLDNVSTHKHAAVKRWLARRPRIHLHFTPTSASWMNQVELWFSLLTTQAVRRESFKSARALLNRVYAFIQVWNENAKPFRWTKTPDQILEKAIR
jgi:transposase